MPPEEKAIDILPEEPSEGIKEEIEVLAPEKVIEEIVEEVVVVPPEEPLEEIKEEAEIMVPEQEPKVPVKIGVSVPPKVIPGKVKGKIALLPFENFTDNMNVLAQIMPMVKERLEKKGFEVVQEEMLNEFLCKKRVRSTGYISKELALGIGEKFVIKSILAGSVISFSTEGIPKIGLSARLIEASRGLIIWADYVSITGEDFTKMLGLGTIKNMEKLIPEALDRLFISFSTVPIQKEIESTYKIAVMPFQNKSGFKNAGKITMYLFLVELLKNKKFEPIEYGEIRKLIVDLRIRNRGELDHNNIKALSETLDVAGILVGTVEKYHNGRETAAPPKVSITARLLGTRENKILWYNSRQLDGEKDIIAFDWGRIRTVDKLAYKVVSDLIEKMEVAKWH